jgi:hypothetical protein
MHDATHLANQSLDAVGGKRGTIHAIPYGELMLTGQPAARLTYKCL